MPIELRKKEGESVNSFLFRFNKKVQQSGLVKEVKKRQFYSRTTNWRKKRLGALHRLEKREEITKLRRYGYSGR